MGMYMTIAGKRSFRISLVKKKKTERFLITVDGKYNKVFKVGLSFIIHGKCFMAAIIQVFRAIFQICRKEPVE